MAYQPQAGSIPDRVIEYLKLQAPGTKLATPILCEAIEADANSFAACMAPAREAGAVRAQRVQGHRRTLFWSLGDGTAKVEDRVAAEAGAEQEEQEQQFQAAAWSDGDVDLYGLIPLDDGGHRLTADMVAKLKRLITWMPA